MQQEELALLNGVSKRQVKKNTAARGGGGICPAKRHSSYFNVNLAEAADLARVSEAKPRVLTSIPKGYRLEATGLRIVGSDAHEVQASVHTENTLHNPALLEKRSKPEWNGLHVRVTDSETIYVRVEYRSKTSSSWLDLLHTTIDPLAAFSIQDQDIVWHPKKVFMKNDRKVVIVWIELSLTRMTSTIQEAAQNSILVAKQKKIAKVQVDIKQRAPEEVQADQEMLDDLLKQKDTMTLQDKVYMKDIWNKSLAWIDMTGEFMVDGLFLRCPDLLEILGRITAELMFDMLVSLIDKAVRNLDPRTEVIARESYASMPLGSKLDHPFDTLEEGFRQFAALAMRPRHWQGARVLFLLAMKKANPYLEDPDFELLDAGVDSCTYKFWNQHIMLPALEAIKKQDDMYESPENKQMLATMLSPLMTDKHGTGMLFYKCLFTQHPNVIRLFGKTDMNFLAGHLFDAIELLIEVFNNFGAALPVLYKLGKIHDRARVPVSSYTALTGAIDATFREKNTLGYADGTAEGEKAFYLWKELFYRASLVTSRISFVSEKLLRKALEWSEQVAHELEWDPTYLAQRKIAIEEEIRATGTYSHTEEEIVHGARVAWRNSAKCVGRIAWNTMLVRDRRHVTNLDHMFAECLEHQRLATADGSLKTVMTVFKARQPGTRLGIRFWGQQLIRFACYDMPDGSLMGDKANLQYTKECIEFGWKPPEPRTEFDVLPVVLDDTATGETRMFEVPREYHKVTMIEHPNFPEFAKLGLRWCVVPTIISFTLTLGGLQYTCCPFNGWFMECEITRDLIEPGRMDKMEAIAKAIGVDHNDEANFWRERVAYETNRAVVYSFRRDGNSIVDHVTVQAQFLAHDLREKRAGRECPAQWSWVVPSFGGSTMPIWHHEMRDFYIEPAFQYQAEVTALRAFSRVPETDLLDRSVSDDFSFEKILILYASVTGTAEAYAYKAKKLLRPLKIDVKSCEKVDPKALRKEFTASGGPYSAVLLIISTFGEGEPPTNAVKFFEVMKNLPSSALKDVPYSMMAIGSRVYSAHCQVGIDIDKYFRNAGAEPVLPLRTADELDDQAGTVMQWISAVGGYFNVEQKKAMVLSGDLPSSLQVEDGPPVTVDLLDATNEKVMGALAEERAFADKIAATHAEVGAAARFLPDGFKFCRVTRNSELVDFSAPGSEDAYRSTRFLEFDLADFSKEGGETVALEYQTGDHAKIMPSNFPPTVAAMCKHSGLAPDQWVEIKVEEGMGRPLTTSVARVQDIFTYEIDLATQDSDGNLGLFHRLYEVARSLNATESAFLDVETRNSLKAEVFQLGTTIEKLSGQDTRDRDAKASKKGAIANLMEKYLDIPSVLADYPVAASKLTLVDFVEVLPRLKSRYYSIASASELHPSKLQLTVGVLKTQHGTNSNVRLGLCSNLLAASTAASSINGESRNSASSFVRMGVSTSTFRPPSDLSCPTIMVGTGTGISPLLGFLQAREKALADGRRLGPCMVFFGCRTEADFLHKEQMRIWEGAGVIADLQLAFSRPFGCPKEYVQHRMSKIRDVVWGYLKDNKCHFYVCGDSNMAEDVYEELLRTACEAGGLGYKDSWEFFQKMKTERRFQSDTWGVVSKREEGLAKQAEKKYNQALNWFEQIREKEN